MSAADQTDTVAGNLDKYDAPPESGAWPLLSPEPDPFDCAMCGGPAEVVETFDDQIGFEEQARPVVVTVLACGHEIVTPGRWDPR